ncbi:PREDICTED: uncharacterized protein LOC105362485 [Ceratosolen solmsi marchali]|uniref:Uncharacterized protein LOC105362485 n=1 Tax=Ceratosolen solmsi marchali TaxID=326594 RepID=A0AAJ6YHN3_9HYME|nr:PREDICTED: uncharacterized protein LOC105362485 [Ceratosolen solmsi marchali]
MARRMLDTRLVPPPSPPPQSLIWLLLLLLVLLTGTALPAVVLPRPPSLPNYIPIDYVASSFDSVKNFGDKGLHQRTNVEKPETQQDYRFLEIEVRDGENVENLDLHGIVQAVLAKQRQLLPLSGRRFDEEDYNMTYPPAEIVPRSIVGVHEVVLGPNQRFYESATLEAESERSLQYPMSSPQSEKNLSDEKLYYLKNGRPKVYVNFRGKSGNFRQQDTPTGADSRFTLRLEPSTFLKATQPYHTEKKTKSSKSTPKKYDARIHGSTTEHAMVTSSELPKQIPAPPSRLPALPLIVQTTPVQRYNARRTDILPDDSISEA